MKKRIIYFVLYLGFLSCPIIGLSQPTTIKFENNQSDSEAGIFTKSKLLKIADYVIMSALAIGLIVIIKDIVIEQKFKKGIINWFIAFMVWEIIKKII